MVSNIFQKMKNKFHFFLNVLKSYPIYPIHGNSITCTQIFTILWQTRLEFEKNSDWEEKNKHRSSVSLVIQAKHRNHGNKGRQLRWCNQHKHLYYNHLYKRYMRPKKNHLKFSFSGQKFQNIIWQAGILFLKQLSFFS